LKADYRGKRAVVTASVLRDFLVNNPQLPAAYRALRKLESAERGALNSAGSDEFDGRSRSSDPGVDVRDELRALRAKVATLDDELERAHLEGRRLRAQRDAWRERARIHRQALRGQLDLEEALDSSNIDS
jgi:hypothetical protein